jgi:hypothetical protein
MTDTFGTCLTCLDGRVQEPLQQWLKEKHKVNYVDMITEHGVVKLFSDDKHQTNFRTKIHHSISNGNSKIILVSAHHDCEGNMISKDEQISQIKDAISTIQSWNLDVPVVGAWVNEQFQVESI